MITTKDIINRNKLDVFYSSEFAEAFGLHEAIILCKLISLRETRVRDDGFTWCLYDELSRQIGLTHSQIRRAVKNLEEGDVIEVKRMYIQDKKSRRSPISCNHFKINDKIVKFWIDAPTLEEDKEIMKNVRF